MMELKFENAIDGLKGDRCPACQNALTYDVQSDSIYVSCSCGNFEVSTFRDKFNGNLLLFYLNQADMGNVDGRNLNKLQEILYRNNAVKKQLFSLKLKEQLF